MRLTTVQSLLCTSLFSEVHFFSSLPLIKGPWQEAWPLPPFFPLSLIVDIKGPSIISPCDFLPYRNHPRTSRLNLNCSFKSFHQLHYWSLHIQPIITLSTWQQYNGFKCDVGVNTYSPHIK